jgi:signal transduction histidine kinase
MRLHDFILKNREQILVEWEEFARTREPASITMDVTALRDHASEMLTVIVADLKTYQSEPEQAEKAKGREPDNPESEETAAEGHGAGRAESGFTVAQMVSEFRALRATVLRLWTRERGELKSTDLADLNRFNEALDQALAESVVEFTKNVDGAKDMFLAILGHDLRTPLSAIYTSAMFIHDTGGLEEPHRTLTSRMADTAMRTTYVVGDLLDFTRSRLGRGIPISRGAVNLQTVLQRVTDEVVAAHPERKVQLATSERQIGQWDEARIGQALTNLLENAIQHGSSDTPISVELSGDEVDVAVTIHNRGITIPGDELDGIFNPMKANKAPQKASALGPTGNLGLGLYIAERIVHAHDGRIEVDSSEAAGTTFTVHLPRGD